MGFLFPLALFVVFISCLLFIFSEGMWGAALRFVNVVTAALLATNFWEPLARLLENNVSESVTYWWDFLSWWGIFALALFVLRFATGKVSRVKVRFLAIVNKLGGAFFAALVGVVMVCAVNFTIHLAPLGEKAMFGGFDPAKPVVFKPDRQWWGFMSRVSRGAFSRIGGPRQFDPQAQFVGVYAERRKTLENLVKEKKSFTASSPPAR